MRDKILELRSQGMTYQQIAEIVGCSKGAVGYHCNPNLKEKSKLRMRAIRQKLHPYVWKLRKYCSKKKSKKVFQYKYITRQLVYKRYLQFIGVSIFMAEFTFQDVINKISENPVCYLTGDSIDINDPKSYSFDHIIPKSRGGDNSLDNLGVCTKVANISKTDMTPDEFIYLCKKVLLHNGYTVDKR